MSFSVCIKCESMVSGYQKYCNACVERYGVRQDESWHKKHSFDNWDAGRKAEFEKDVALSQNRAN